jgi:hypothetical protein
MISKQSPSCEAVIRSNSDDMSVAYLRYFATRPNAVLHESGSKPLVMLLEDIIYYYYYYYYYYCICVYFPSPSIYVLQLKPCAYAAITYSVRAIFSTHFFIFHSIIWQIMGHSFMELSEAEFNETFNWGSLYSTKVTCTNVKKSEQNTSSIKLHII